MSRTYKAKTTFRWHRWYIKHVKHKQLRAESKERISNGIKQKDDVWLIPEETESLVSYYYPELY